MAQQDKLNALRSGNLASINATADAANRGGSMAAGNTVQDILSKNAMLKQQQQQEALRTLSGQGTGLLSTGAEWGRQEAPDVQAQLAVSQAPINDLFKTIQLGMQAANPFLKFMQQGGGGGSSSGGGGGSSSGGGGGFSGGDASQWAGSSGG
jgi:hypothetical protein